MSRFPIFRVLALLGAVAACSAAQQQKPEIKQEPTSYTSANSGSEMYAAYCASCHGKDAKGNGPAAPALKLPPPDLTTLAKRNGGKYPTLRVESILQGRESLVSHGDQEMPVWGPVFRAMTSNPNAMVAMRIQNLNQYLESLQVK